MNDLPGDAETQCRLLKSAYVGLNCRFGNSDLGGGMLWMFGFADCLEIESR